MKKRKKYAFKQTAAQRLASYRKRVATRRANEAAARLRRPGKSVVKHMIEAEQVASASPNVTGVLRGISAPVGTYTMAFHDEKTGRTTPLGPDAEAEQSWAEPQMAGDGLVGGLSLHATLEALVDHYSVRDIMETLTSLVRGHLGTGPAFTRDPRS